MHRTPELSEHYYRMRAYHQRIDPLVPEGATLFIGDSLTQGLATSAVSASSVNYGIGADTTFGVLQRLPKYTSILSAKAIVMAIGVNDLVWRPLPEIVENYRQILLLLPKTAHIVVSAVLPVDENRPFVAYSNQKIFELNAHLKVLSAYHANAIYIDAGQSLMDELGNLKDEYHRGDGVHLSEAGYRIWIARLKQGLNEIIETQKIPSKTGF